MQNLYAARSACLFALSKIEIKNFAALKEKPPGEEEDVFDPQKPWIPRPTPYMVTLNGIGCDVSIIDEGGKLNINSINDKEKKVFIDFLKSKGIKKKSAEIITDSVLDWKDKDDLHHMNGAETPYYSRLPEPYEAKNAPFDSAEELALVKGVTPEIYENIMDGITVFGSGKINLNFTSAEVLASVPKIDKEIAGAILQRIKSKGPFKTIEGLRSLLFKFGVAGSDFEKVRNHVTLDNANIVAIIAECSASKTSGPSRTAGPPGSESAFDDFTESEIPPRGEDAADKKKASKSKGPKSAAMLTHKYKIIAEISGKNRSVKAAYAD